jgi:hypothetical protein
VEWDDYDVEDQVDADMVLPHDLDTTSLAIHAIFPRFVVKHKHEHVDSSDVENGLDPS